MIQFDVLARDGAARRGRLVTTRGTLETPVFMPVGTAATVKTLEPRDLVADAALRQGRKEDRPVLLSPGGEELGRLEDQRDALQNRSPPGTM